MVNPIDDWLAENYEQLVADPNRGVTYESIAEVAETQNATDLAAWARGKAAKAGKDVTPKVAKSKPAAETRD